MCTWPRLALSKNSLEPLALPRLNRSFGLFYKVNIPYVPYQQSFGKHLHFHRVQSLVFFILSTEGIYFAVQQRDTHVNSTLLHRWHWLPSLCIQIIAIYMIARLGITT